MSKVKSDADILALFARVSEEVKRAGAGSRKARAISPAYHGDQNEWSDLELSNMIAAELEERQLWVLSGAVMLRGEQRCICGRSHTNTFGIYARERHRNGCIRLRKPTPEDYAMLEVLERHVEYAPVEFVTNCADCFEWGEQRLQYSFPFEGQGSVPPEIQELVDLTVTEMFARPAAEPHNYFGERTEPVAVEDSSEDDDASPMDTFEAFRQLKNVC